MLIPLRAHTLRKRNFYMKACLALCIGSFWLSSCRSHVMPCPSFSHLSKESAYELGKGSQVKFDKKGRVKK